MKAFSKALNLSLILNLVHPLLTVYCLERTLPGKVFLGEKTRLINLFFALKPHSSNRIIAWTLVRTGVERLTLRNLTGEAVMRCISHEVLGFNILEEVAEAGYLLFLVGLYKNARFVQNVFLGEYGDPQPDRQGYRIAGP